MKINKKGLIIIAVYDSSRTGNAHDNDENRLTSLEQFRSMFLDMTYPVGAIYMSVNATSPATLFGGAWEAIEGRFLIGTNSTYTPGSTGGEASHTLTVAEMPAHNGHTTPMSGGGAYYLNSSVLTGYGSIGRGWQVLAGNEAHPVEVSKGSSAAHNNMPPYLAVYMWKRTA